MPTPPDPRKKPTSLKIHVSSGTGVDVTWADGHTSHYEFAYLREECPCATCNDAREKKQSLGEVASAFKSSPALPMFKPAAKPSEVEPVGKYAIKFKWNDGHELGIYSWQFLRDVCPCEECKPTRQPEHV